MSKETVGKDILGKPLKCLICGHDRFTVRNAQLNTRMATFLNLDWANKTAECFLCEQCGHIHWFMPQ